MPARSLESANDKFVNRARALLACVSRATVLTTHIAGTERRTLLLASRVVGKRSTVTIATHGGDGEVLLRLLLDYRVAAWARPERSREFDARIIAYGFEVMNRNGSDLVAFHWHPETASPFRRPHLHVVAAGSIVLPQRTSSVLAATRTHLGRMHLPTGPVEIEDVVEMLIREFAAVPLRPDWEAVLAANRADDPAGRPG